MIESLQAKIVAGTSVVILLVSIANIIMSAIKNQGSVVAGIIGLIVSIIYLFIIVLDQNCVVIGGCNVWGWVKLVLTEIWLILMLVAVVGALVLVSKGEKIETTQAASSTEAVVEAEPEDAEEFIGAPFGKQAFPKF